MFNASPGVYDRIIDQSFTVNGAGAIAGAIVVSSDRGTLGVNLVTSATQLISEYGEPSRDNPSLYAALRFIQRAGVMSVRRVIANAVAASGTLLNAAQPHLIVTAENPGAWGNSITVKFEDRTAAEGAGVFDLVVYEGGIEVERFMCSRDVDAKNGYGKNIFIEDVVNEQSNYIRVEDNAAITAPYVLSSTVSLAGGSNDSTAITSGAIILAWDDLANPESVSANLLINAGFTAVEVQTKMLAVAESRRDAYAILDVPQSVATDVTGMILHRSTTLGADTYWGGLYGGWLKVFDAANGRSVEIPPSGDVAATFVRTAENAERWDAPAGSINGIIPNAIGVSKVFTEGERDLLYTAGVNPVTSYAGSSAIIWGQRSLQRKASAMDRANVVQLIIWINSSMKDALQPFVFQNNTEFTRSNVNFLLTSFLESIKRRGGLIGYSVDTESGNTPQVIANNQLVISVFVQPPQSAEFIRLNTTISPNGVTLG
jgi:phage tail sheath protein FI